MTRVITVIISVAVLGVLGSWFFLLDREEAAPSEPPLRPAPDLALKNYEGKEIKLSDFRGKPTLVNAWAAWCPFCKEELKDFAAVQKEFGERAVIIAVDRAEPLSVAKKFSDELGVTGDLVLLLDPEDSFYKSIGGFSMPETIFIDGDGNIIYHKRGPMSREEIRRRIEDLLNIEM